MNRDAFVCLVLYELVIILTVLLISVNLQFCLKLSVNFVDLSFLSRISFFFFTLFLKCNLCFSIILCYFTIKVCNISFYFITMIYRSTDKYSFLFYSFSSFRIYSSNVGNDMASPVHMTIRSSLSALASTVSTFPSSFSRPSVFS